MKKTVLGEKKLNFNLISCIYDQTEVNITRFYFVGSAKFYTRCWGEGELWIKIFYLKYILHNHKI